MKYPHLYRKQIAAKLVSMSLYWLVILNFFECSHNVPFISECKDMETSVILLLNKITEHLTLKKLFMTMIKFQILPKTLETHAHPIGELHATEVLTCVRGQVWIATQYDAAVKWRESVSVQLYCQKLTGFIR